MMQIRPYLFGSLLLLSLGWHACRPAGDEGFRELVREITETEQQLAQRQDTVGSAAATAELVRRTLVLAERFPADTLVPDWLFREAKNCMGMEAHDGAVRLWEKIWTQYPTHRHAPVALFMHAFTLDNVHGNVEQAALHYGELVARYPDTEVARQARQLLEVIDLTPEELVRRFQGE